EGEVLSRGSRSLSLFLPPSRGVPSVLWGLDTGPCPLPAYLAAETRRCTPRTPRRRRTPGAQGPRAGEMADSRARAEKIPHQPGDTSSGRKYLKQAERTRKPTSKNSPWPQLEQFENKVNNHSIGL
ncbi:unnamed protein product, partial [Gulo gulo]